MINGIKIIRKIKNLNLKMIRNNGRWLFKIYHKPTMLENLVEHWIFI
jgi:hypothetical protein